ncbi:hypothetical protein M514_09146 [Trichuris suis]|uniref:RPA-interacting protein C-terminal domain-containing protein n=1 Tax=Trichuris suis TaxID=68888 RepID=A0A085LY86_9BILA|nr:hypothetical protein M513_09146 [Trichuris suis]KFD60038.1 hypothetical protein M514_09146 [Trichuris suis]
MQPPTRKEQWKPSSSMQSFMERQRQNFARQRICIRQDVLQRLRSDSLRKIRAAITRTDPSLEALPDELLVDETDADDFISFEQRAIEDQVNSYYDETKMICPVCCRNNVFENEHGIACPCGRFSLPSRVEQTMTVPLFKHLLDQRMKKHEESCSVPRDLLFAVIFVGKQFSFVCPYCGQIESIP